MKPIEKMIEDAALTKNDPPENLKEGELWAERSGVLKIGNATLRVHVLNNGQRIVDADDVKEFLTLVM